MALSLITILLMTAGITAVGIGVGAVYPKFAYENAAEIPTSFGGAVCMILSMSFIALIVMLEAWPIYRLTMAQLRSAAFMPSGFTIVPALAAATLVTGLAVYAALRFGVRHLERLTE